LPIAAMIQRTLPLIPLMSKRSELFCKPEVKLQVCLVIRHFVI
jgi:hypothetical protein